MRILTLLGVGLSLAALATQPLAAEERHADKPAAVEPKKEGHDAMKEGTKGVSVGTIVSLEKGKLVLRTKEGDLLFMPNWKGGMPKDGGGFDKAMLEKLEGFKAGDMVDIEWTWQERRRIDSIVKE